MKDLGVPRGAVDRIHHVVQVGGELVNVLAIERRDERAVEAVDDLVCDLIRLVLEPLDRFDMRHSAVGRCREQILEMLRRLDVARRHRDEQVEKLLLPG